MFLLFLFLCPVFTNQTYSEETVQVLVRIDSEKSYLKRKKMIMELDLLSLHIKQFPLIIHLFKGNYT